jgi:DNA polymerase III subunit gamma/tau
MRWADVVGQDHVAITLKNALQSGKIAHAFLFTGPRGVGKTTCARILARVLNCENPTSDWEPCNQCASCKSSMENASFNIFELDAASNNSVEDIRELVDQVRYQPQAGKYKIYIVDEVHMLSTAAFNAFLKTLEEPPPYAKFILATTEKHKIIPTILSRCQIYDFRRIRQKDMVKQLQDICDKEQIIAEPEALHLIAQKADGAMRDALSTLDRITSFSGKQLSYQDVVENLNILDYDYYFQLTDAFLTENIQSALLLIDKIIQLGFDVETLLEGLASHLRNLMICKNIEMQIIFEGSEGMKQRYTQQSDLCNLAFLIKGLDLINEAEVNLPRARNKRLHLEILITKLCFAQRKVFVESSAQGSTNPLVAEKKNPEIKTEEPTAKKSEFRSATPEKEIQQPGESTGSIKKIVETKSEAPAAAIPKMMTIPKLQSLDILKNKVATEEQIRKSSLIAYDVESAQKFWEQCKEEVKSNSLKVFVQSARLTIDQNQFILHVGSIIAREALKQELRLDEKIGNTFSDKDIRIVIELDPGMAAQEEKTKPLKLLSAKEKWDLMVASNPQLTQFREQLHLKIDED